MEQLPEILVSDGVLYTLYTTPLLPWLREHDEAPAFDRRSPSCERGYVGRWLIDDERLWLTGLYAWRNGVYTGVADLFDGRREVAADWFTGPLVIEPASTEAGDGVAMGAVTLLVVAGRVTRRMANPGA